MSARITWRAKDRIGTSPAPRGTVGGRIGEDPYTSFMIVPRKDDRNQTRFEFHTWRDGGWHLTSVFLAMADAKAVAETVWDTVD